MLLKPLEPQRLVHVLLSKATLKAFTCSSSVWLSPDTWHWIRCLDDGIQMFSNSSGPQTNVDMYYGRCAAMLAAISTGRSTAVQTCLCYWSVIVVIQPCPSFTCLILSLQSCCTAHQLGCSIIFKENVWQWWILILGRTWTSLSPKILMYSFNLSIPQCLFLLFI